MAQHDYVIANGTGAAVRSDLNGALGAIVTQNSGATEPTTTYAYMPWADTTTGLFKIRNAANTGWITLYQLDGEWSTIALENGTAVAPSLYFLSSGTDTGLFSPAADQVGISTGGVVRLTTSTSAFTGTLPWRGQNGTAGAPAISFSGDSNTGLYNVGADQLGITTNGVNRATVSTTAFTSTLPVDVPLGSATAPSLTFTGDLNTGIFSPTADTIGFTKGGAEAARFDSSGRFLVGTSTASGNALLQIAGDAQIQSLNGGPLSGTRNRIINGGMAIDARNAGASQTFTAAAALAYAVDRWYGYCTGANVTGQRITGATAGQYYYRFTGATSVTAIGFGHRIEQLNSTDLAGTTATLSVDLANSVLTTVTWTAYYATTADSFGTLASPTRTQIATGTFTVTSTVTRYNTNISISAAATTGIEIVFTVGAQTSGTWTIGNVQLEAGTVATPFERRSYGQELALCQRYYEEVDGEYRHDGSLGGANISVGHMWFAKQEKRATPTVSVKSESGSNCNNISGVTAKTSGGAIAIWEWTSGTSVVTRNKAAIIKFSAEL